METWERRARGTGISVPIEYELSALINIAHLGSLCDIYFKSYGVDLDDRKLWKRLVDLFHCTVAGTRASDTHRWLSVYFNEGLEFIDRFEQETRMVLSHTLPLWREYDPETFVISIEHHLASTFIGFRKMFPNCSKNTLKAISDDDRAVLNKLTPTFKQDFVIDLSKAMPYGIDDQELLSLNNCQITWAYLIEECMRVNYEIVTKNPHCTEITDEMIADHLDVNELSMRFSKSSLSDRLMTVEDERAANTVFDMIVVELAGIIERILYWNSPLFTMMADQLLNRAMLSGQGGYVYYCVNLEWMNKSAIVTFAGFLIDLGISDVKNLMDSIGG